MRKSCHGGKDHGEYDDNHETSLALEDGLSTDFLWIFALC